MPTIIIGTVFSIYTLILIVTLILLLKSDEEIHQKRKKIFENGIRTQGKITEVHHPQRKRKKRRKANYTSMSQEERMANDTEKYKIVVAYEYEVKEKTKTTKTLIGESCVHLDVRNRELMKGQYRVGDVIDIFYLKDNPSLVDTARHVTPIKGDNIFVFTNIIALLSSLLVLGLLVFVGLSDTTNTVPDALAAVFGFLMYVFLMLGDVAITFGGFFCVKEYLQLLQLKKKGLKEKGEVLETWEIDQGRGGISYSVRYTYPAIAPFSIETSVHRKLNE
ncbi:MAG: DUF3592 domain-containing protein, partial [Chitinophagales bacterium]